MPKNNVYCVYEQFFEMHNEVSEYNGTNTMSALIIDPV
jgi:hypothetical protein